MIIGYTTIMHRPRLALGLSCNEYCLADLIYKLATNPKAPVFGWCSASQPNLGKALGVSRQSINTMIKKLVGKAILIKSKNGKLLKTGDIWAEVVVTYNFKDDRNGQESLHTVKKVDSQESLQPVKILDTEQSRKLTPNSQESLHNNNRDNNTLKSIDNNSMYGDKSPATNPKKEVETKNKDERLAEPSKAQKLNKHSVNQFKEVMEYLIAKTGRAFKIAKTDALIKRSDKFKKIAARLREGYAVSDLKTVIDTKCKEWLESPKMSQFLQPSTLFCARNFEKYLDQAQNTNLISHEKQQQPKTSRNGSRVTNEFRNGVDSLLSMYDQAIGGASDHGSL